jgi:N-acetylmuramoyl-L-alanine amidase
LSITAATLLCLSAVVHYEARGEPLEGKVAVASVVMNRVESGKFPDTVCKVVSQPRQFSWFHKKTMKHGAEKQFALDFLKGKYKRNAPNSYFFTSGWAKLNRPITNTIGGHIFYGL